MSYPADAGPPYDRLKADAFAEGSTGVLALELPGGTFGRRGMAYHRAARRGTGAA
jgi:hypothetical protein